VPLVLGFLKPVVLFPVALANNMDLNQVEAILIHELSHIRRNDYLLNLVKTAIETILFFNPFIWLSGRFIHIEREHACDDLVVAFTGTPVTYAHALLKLELLQAKNSPAMTMAATGKPQYLYQRIKRITNMKANYMNVRQQILLITITFSTIISLAWINPDQSKAAVKRIVAKVASKIDVFEQQLPEKNVELTLKKTKLSLPADTTKKKPKLKITIEDAKGNTTTYNSINELPDSLKTTIGGREIYIQGHPLTGKEFKSIRDSAFIAGLSPKVKELLVNLRGPDAQEKLRILGLESRATADAFVKKFNTQEEKAKWTKLQVDLRKNSDEFIKKFNTPEEKARLMQLVQDAQRSVYQIDPIIVKGYPSNAVTGLKVDTTKRIKLRVNGKNYEDEMKLLMTPEYQELRKKFETEVNELRKKKGLENNKN
ncbi:MAG: M56 family metallopeptidase, partial [Pedobacter sp.]